MKKLSDNELIIMTYIWDLTEAGKPVHSFADLMGHFKGKWTKQNLHATLMNIQTKGILLVEGDHVRKEYQALISRKEYICALADEVLPGSGERVREVL